MWCPYHKQAAGDKKGLSVVSPAISGGAAASSSAGPSLPAASSSSADGANSGEPPAKRQRVSTDVNDMQDEEAAGAAEDGDKPAPFCVWEGSYGDLLATHLKKDCQFHKIPCPQGCGAEIMRSGVELHKSGECPRFFEECSICGSRVKTSGMEKHREESLAIHVSILEKQKMELQGENEDLKKQNASLTKTNAVLINSVLPQLQSVKTTTESLKATTATKSDVQSLKSTTEALNATTATKFGDVQKSIVSVQKASEGRILARLEYGSLIMWSG